MARPKPLNKSVRTIPKTTGVLSTSEEGYSTPVVGQPQIKEPTVPVDDDALKSQEEPSDETEVGPPLQEEVSPVVQTPAPLIVDTRTGSPVLVEEEQEQVPMTDGLGLMPPKPRLKPLPPLPANEPKGVVLGVDDPLVVRGFRVGENVVQTTEPVYRRILPSGSSRWSHRLLYPTGAYITGAHVKLVSEVEQVAA